MKLNPIHNHVLVRPIEADESIGAIFIPGEHRRDTNEGIVVAVGPGRINGAGVLEPVGVAEGEHIVYEQPPKGMSYESCQVDGEKLLVMREAQVLAVREA